MQYATHTSVSIPWRCPRVRLVGNLTMDMDKKIIFDMCLLYYHKTWPLDLMCTKTRLRDLY